MLEQVTIEKPELKIPTTIKALVEVLIFAAQEPLTLGQIRTIYQCDNPRSQNVKQIEPETIRQIIADLNKEYEKHDRAYRIVQIAGGYQFATLSTYAEWLGKLYKEQGRRKLSQSGIETLAIIAYKQPITKAEVEKIRGVNCDYVLKTLLEKELLTVTGRAESVGRPLLYGTTREFLKHFGLNDITDLPRPREIEEILGESQFETERRMLEAQAGAEQMKKEQDDFKSRLPHIPKKKPELDVREVEIVHQKKTREIRIVPVEDQKILEEAGQEQIHFLPDDSIKIVKPITPQSVQEGNSLEEAILPEQGNALPEVIVTEAKDDITQLPEVIHKDIPAVENEAASEETILELKGDRLSTIEEVNKVTEKQAKENQPQQKRWQIWKEKIQGFIKKLFV